MAKGYIRGRARSQASLDPNGFKRIRTTITNLSVTVTTITTSAGFAGIPLVLPEGYVAIACAGGLLSYSTASTNVTNATFGSNLSIGTAADAAGTTSLAGALGSVAASTAAPAAVAKVVTNAKVFGGMAAQVNVDNHSANTTLFLNINVAAADMSDGTTAAFVFNGYIDVICAVLGDT